MADIRRFLHANAATRQAMLSNWRHETAARVLALQAAGLYLGRLEPTSPQLYLVRWDEPSVLAWFPARGPSGPLPFFDAIASARDELARRRIATASGGYARVLDIAGEELTGEVGFRLRRSDRIPAGARLQQVPASIFATLDCEIDDEKAAHRVFRFLSTFSLSSHGISSGAVPPWRHKPLPTDDRGDAGGRELEPSLPSGRLSWETSDIEGDHVVTMLSQRVSDSINGSMLAAGLVDEVSLLLVPVVDGRVGTPALCDVDPGDATPRGFVLEAVEQRAGGILWLRYRPRTTARQG